MKYFYCDSCFLISFYQNGNLESLSKFKDHFFVSKTQIECELIKPLDLATAVKKSITVIEKDRDEIINKAKEICDLYETLSFFDCLCMAYSSLDNYCLLTDDKALIKKCALHNIETITSKDVLIKQIV